jgi:hypothetical protein
MTYNLEQSEYCLITICALLASPSSPFFCFPPSFVGQDMACLVAFCTCVASCYPFDEKRAIDHGREKKYIAGFRLSIGNKGLESCFPIHVTDKQPSP